MSIERDFDVPLIAGLALREKQIQQNYRPVIGVHKWFARRPGTLFRGLLLAEFGTGPLQETFFAGNDLLGRRIADPFMGGGTPVIEANRLGCDVQGFDLNPMAAWIVREEIDHLDLTAYGRAAGSLVDTLRGEIGRYYRTFCPRYGDAEVPVKSFLWVKTLDCAGCGESSEGDEPGQRLHVCPDRDLFGAAQRHPCDRHGQSDGERLRSVPRTSIGRAKRCPASSFWSNWRSSPPAADREPRLAWSRAASMSTSPRATRRLPPTAAPWSLVSCGVSAHRR